MSHSIIASQLDPQANQYLREQLADHEISTSHPSCRGCGSRMPTGA